MAKYGDVKECRLCGGEAVLKRIPQTTSSLSGADGGAIAEPIPPQDVWECAECGDQEPFNGEIER